GEPRTGMGVGVSMTVLTIAFNVMLIPKFGTLGAALGTIASSTIVAIWGVRMLFAPRSVIQFHRGMELRPDWAIIRSLFRFGLPAGVYGSVFDLPWRLPLGF